MTNLTNQDLLYKIQYQRLDRIDLQKLESKLIPFATVVCLAIFSFEKHFLTDVSGKILKDTSSMLKNLQSNFQIFKFYKKSQHQNF